VIRDFLDHLAVERGHTPNTLAAYRRDLERYREWLAASGIDVLSAVFQTDIDRYVAELSTGDDDHRPLAPRSVARSASAVRGLHRFAVAEGHVEQDVTNETVLPRPPLRLPKAIDVDAVGRLLSAATVSPPPKCARDVALLELLYGTGARVSEALALDVDDIDLTESSVVLSGKGGKIRTVPLGGYANRVLADYIAVRAEWKPRGPHLFLNSRGGRLTRQGAYLILRTCAEIAGLPAGIGPHTLRHSYATHLLDGGADVRVVQELLGHAAVSTTQIYTLVTVDRLREVYSTSHPRAR